MYALKLKRVTEVVIVTYSLAVGLKTTRLVSAVRCGVIVRSSQLLAISTLT